MVIRKEKSYIIPYFIETMINTRKISETLIAYIEAISFIHFFKQTCDSGLLLLKLFICIRY